MDKTLKNTKLWATTLYYAKLLAATKGITMVQLIHDLIMRELQDGKSEN